MRTRDLVKLRNTGHPGINALFAKAHSADWDIERDVDWSVAIDPEDPLVARAWTAFGTTPTFATLPEHARRYVTRRALGRMLNILQVGESVAQNVCAKLVLTLREEDYRNHAVAQAMDEARHHLAYRRFIDKMGEEVEDIDLGTEMMFDALLAMDDPLDAGRDRAVLPREPGDEHLRGHPAPRDASAAARPPRADHARREPPHGLRHPVHRRVDARGTRSTSSRVRAPLARTDPRRA